MMVKELAGFAESSLETVVARGPIGDGRLKSGRGATEIDYPPVILVSSRPVPVRNEGLAERAGEIILLVTRGSGAYGTLNKITFDVRVALNTNITNSRSNGGVLDVAIKSDGEQETTTPLIRARRTSDTALVFDNISVILTESLSPILLRIDNIRVNATQLGNVLFGATVQDVIAHVSVTSNVPVAVQNCVVTLGVPRPSYQFALRNIHDGVSAPVPIVLGPDENAIRSGRAYANGHAEWRLLARFREQFWSVFQTKEREASGGEPMDASVLWGTRFVVRFLDVPDDVRIWVTIRDVVPGVADRGNRSTPKAVKIVGATSSGVGGEPLAIDTPELFGTSNEDEVIRNEISVDRGFAFAVWEWVDNDPASAVSADELFFGITLRSQRFQTNLGFLRVSGDIGPLSTSGTSIIVDGKVPVPRFVEACHHSALELDPTTTR